MLIHLETDPQQPQPKHTSFVIHNKSPNPSLKDLQTQIALHLKQKCDFDDFQLLALSERQNCLLELNSSSQKLFDLTLADLGLNSQELHIRGKLHCKKPKIAPLVPSNAGKPISPFDCAKIRFSSVDSYYFYEKDSKFLMVILKIPGIEKVPKSHLNVKFNARSLDVKILSNPPDFASNWRFRVPKTHDKYIPEGCKFWVKKGKVLLKLRKKNEKANVFSLYKQKMVGEKLKSDSEDEI